MEQDHRPVAYVRRALTNGFVSDRRRGRHRDVPLTHVVDTGQPYQPLDETHDRSVLWPALLALPERQRAAIVLRHYDDLPDTEIADAIGCRHRLPPRQRAQPRQPRPGRPALSGGPTKAPQLVPTGRLVHLVVWWRRTAGERPRRHWL